MIDKFIVPFTVLFMVAHASESRADCTTNCTNWNQGGPMLRGSGKVITQTRQVAKFNAVSVVSGGSVQIERTGTAGVSVSADDNLISLFTTEVKGSTLYLAFAQGKSFHGTNPVYRITVADLQSIEVTGAGNVTASKLDEDRLWLSLPGSGSLRISGKANEFSVDIKGSGDIAARDLTTRRAKVSIGGSGSVAVNASEQLDVTISGAGSVSYAGSPKLTQTITGAGAVMRR